MDTRCDTVECVNLGGEFFLLSGITRDSDGEFLFFVLIFSLVFVKRVVTEHHAFCESCHAIN